MSSNLTLKQIDETLGITSSCIKFAKNPKFRQPIKDFLLFFSLFHKTKPITDSEIRIIALRIRKMRMEMN
jgi:hypothetical protein